jgi:hypothetical protein
MRGRRVLETLAASPRDATSMISVCFDSAAARKARLPVRPKQVAAAVLSASEGRCPRALDGLCI